MATKINSTYHWLRSGKEALDAMLEAISGANNSIHLETYTYTASPVGERFRQALIDACSRGVQVRVLVDAMGSMTLPDSFWEPLAEAGGEFRWFNPFRLRRWSYRNHRKLLVCDDELSFIGGCNIAQEYAGDGVKSGWRDLGLKMTGPLGKVLADSFSDYYEAANYRRRQGRTLRKTQRKLPSGHGWKLLLTDSGRHRAEMRRTLARDLAAAKSVRIISAYFLPTWRLRKALMKVAKRGGRVQLILAGKSDVLLSQLAGRRLYRSLLRAGVEVYEYEPQILHAKLFIIDDAVYAGSANLDTRSLRINHELLLRVCDPRLLAEAHGIFEADLLHCRRIDRASWRKARTFWSKLKEDWAYLFLMHMDPYLARLQNRLMK